MAEPATHNYYQRNKSVTNYRTEWGDMSPMYKKDGTLLMNQRRYIINESEGWSFTNESEGWYIINESEDGT